MSNRKLPHKTCPVCGLDFNWRRKWDRHWEHVVYCSQRCRRNRWMAKRQGNE